MEPTEIADRLSANAVVFQHLLAGVDDTQARWKPTPEKWSLLEVVCHLADEERHDFRQRLDLMLHHPGTPWPPIHPSAWVEERGYNTRELEASVQDFLREREHSVAWLRALRGFAPKIPYPATGPVRLTAGTLLHAWAAHDLLHIRQMTRLHHEYLGEFAGRAALDYAGNW